jgi:hypothetical protein
VLSSQSSRGRLYGEPQDQEGLSTASTGDEHVESRTTLFEGGGADVARPTVVATSWSPTYTKSSWTPKVNPFLYASPLPSLLNGMLLHTPSHMHDRFTLTSTEAREEARNIKPDKTEAWKRRRKKSDRQMLSVASGTTGPGDRYYRPLLPPATDDTSASQMLSVTGGTTGPGSGTTGPRHYRPLLPPPTDGSS